MHRPVRPKSAKGKVRPTPPSRPRVESSIAGSSSSTSTSRQYAPQPSTSGRSISKRTTDNRSSKSFSRRREEKSQNGDEAKNHIDPSALPDIMRPVSSLSKFGILPRITATPGTGDVRNASPAESEMEIDLMSSFAQQMILDSAILNNSNNTSTSHTSSNTNIIQANANEKPHEKSNMQRSIKSSEVQQNEMQKKLPKPPSTRGVSSHLDGPSRKKSRTTTTSVFNRKTNPSRIPPEPQDGQEKFKIALKLPDGRRVERYFSPRDTITDVMQYAQLKMRISASHCDIFSMAQVPKVLIKNWNKTLEQLDVRDRTVLYIDKKDEFCR